MTLDKDIILSVIFAGIPLALGYTVIANWLIKTYWGWLWKGIKKQCPECMNEKEIKIGGKG